MHRTAIKMMLSCRLHCLVTEEHACGQVAQSCNAEVEPANSCSFN